MIRIVAIGGAPGTGKSTLMRQLLPSLGDGDVFTRGLLRGYSYPSGTYVLGLYPPGEKFGGTDKLSMGVMPYVRPFLREIPDGSTVLFEGDRLFSPVLLEQIHGDPRYAVLSICLTADDEERERRYRERQSNQNEAFVRGRVTKCINILRKKLAQPYRNHTLQDQQMILDVIRSFLRTTVSPSTDATPS